VRSNLWSSCFFTGLLGNDCHDPEYCKSNIIEILEPNVMGIKFVTGSCGPEAD
jgi:hypothetical protein